MPPRNFIDATVSTYGEPEADRAERIGEWVLDNFRLIVLLAILCAEIVLGGALRVMA